MWYNSVNKTKKTTPFTPIYKVIDMKNNTIDFEEITRVTRLYDESSVMHTDTDDDDSWREESDELLDEEDIAILDSGVTAHHFL